MHNLLMPRHNLPPRSTKLTATEDFGVRLSARSKRTEPSAHSPYKPLAQVAASRRRLI